jgi:hypothetical protein
VAKEPASHTGRYLARTLRAAERPAVKAGRRSGP